MKYKDQVRITLQGMKSITDGNPLRPAHSTAVHYADIALEHLIDKEDVIEELRKLFRPQAPNTEYDRGVNSVINVMIQRLSREDE